MLKFLGQERSRFDISCEKHDKLPYKYQKTLKESHEIACVEVPIYRA
jgi:hypothetical protein